jgi:outer membrane receptor protein involved in Fe transport
LDFREDPGFTNLSSDRQLQSLAKLRFSPTAATSLDVLAAFVARRRDSYFFWNGLTDALNPGSIQLSQSSTPSGSNDNFTTLLMLQPQLTHRAGASIINVRLRGYATLIRPINDDGSLKPLSQGTAGARFGGEFQWQRFLANSNQIIGGLAIDANATKSSFYQTADGGSAGRQPEAGLYAQWESRPLPRVSSVAGLRYDRFRISSRETTQRLSPKLAVGYDVIPGLTLRTSFGLGFRVPSLAERYTDDQSFFPIFKNPFIRPERSTSLEAGARGFLDVFEEWSIDWDVAAFSYWLQDLIEPRFVRAVTSGGTQLGFQFVNVPNGWVRGLESRVEFARSSGVRVRAGHTLLTSRDAETMAPLPFRPQHLVVLGVDLTARRLNLGLDYRYASRPETVDSDFARFVPDADILVDTQVVDVVLGMRTGVTAVRFIVRNALNHYHLERPALLAAPRSFIIQLSATL